MLSAVLLVVALAVVFGALLYLSNQAEQEETASTGTKPSAAAAAAGPSKPKRKKQKKPTAAAAATDDDAAAATTITAAAVSAEGLRKRPASSASTAAEDAAEKKRKAEQKAEAARQKRAAEDARKAEEAAKARLQQEERERQWREEEAAEKKRAAAEKRKAAEEAERRRIQEEIQRAQQAAARLAADKAAAAQEQAAAYEQDKLAAAVFGAYQRVLSNSKSSVPSAARLAAYVETRAVPSIRPAARGAPEAVVRRLQQAFAGCGWDYEKNVAAAPAKLSVASLLAALEALAKEYPRPHKAWAGGATTAAAAAPRPASPSRPPPNVKPTSEELGDVRKACSRLWQLDVGRLVQGDDYVIDLQRGKKPFRGDQDYASDPLFTFVDPAVLKRPTFRTFVALMDNYTRQTGRREVVTHTERRENDAFLEAIMDTPVMQFTQNYLVGKKVVRDAAAFKKELDDMWFKLYRRDAKGDSCGFEHVFVGEDDSGQIKGMHNWLQLYLEEKAGQLDYKGYIYPRRRHFSYDDPFENDHVVTIQFAWHGQLKPISTSFVGVTPEFEMALYTLCFHCGREENLVWLGDDQVNVRVHKYGRGDWAMIGTSFPEEPNA